MSCRVQWHSLPYHPGWVLEVCPLCGLNKPPSCSFVLVAFGRSMGGIYPGLSVARTGRDHLPPASALYGGSSVQGQGDDALTLSVPVLWGFPGGAGQGQPRPIFCLSPPRISYKVIYSWLLLVLGLEFQRWNQTVIQSWLLLVPCLETFSQRYRD